MHDGGACDLSVIRLLQRPQEIRLALTEQPRKQRFPDASRPGARVAVQWRVFRGVLENLLRVRREQTHKHTHADRRTWFWTDVAHLVTTMCNLETCGKEKDQNAGQETSKHDTRSQSEEYSMCHLQGAITNNSNCPN